MNHKNMPNFEKLLHETWSVFTVIWKRLLKLYLFSILIAIAAGFTFASIFALGIVMAGDTGVLGAIISVLTILVALIVLLCAVTWITVTLIRAIKNREKPFELMNSLKESEKHIIPYLITTGIPGLIVSQGLVLYLTLIWLLSYQNILLFVVLFIPGIIVTIMVAHWFYFVPYQYIYQGTKGFAALEMSRAYVKGRWWRIYLLAAFPPLILFAFSFMIAVGNLILSDYKIIVIVLAFIRMAITIFSMPLLLIYQTLLYEHAKESYIGEVVVLTKRKRTIYIASSMCGIIVLFALLFIAVGRNLSKKSDFIKQHNQETVSPSQAPMYVPEVNNNPDVFQNITPSETYPEYSPSYPSYTE